jgi:serine/threonine protein kinase
MDTPSRELLSQLYHAALERTPEERSAFLKDACKGDLQLQQELESLLRHEPAAARFLDIPAAQILVNAQKPDPEMVGRQLGPYKMAALLGAGGMGEVYRARDTKLGRDVAIKILPVDFTVDPERQARFVREARLLATLNHPHIGAIYGLEESDGVAALVLEFVDGPTLADRLEHGPLPIAEALATARQIAEALEAAHERGIVHRDLKPANVILQGPRSGTAGDVRAKVLDFGLAKLVAVDLAGELPQELSLTGTADRRILGTPAYMSPEQARGQSVDKRADIWAFGCVLFEMLSGRRAFEGDTTTDTLARILEHDPDWSLLPATVPASIRRLLRRCLEKNPERRQRDIGDARLDIEEAVSAPLTGSAQGGSDTQSFPLRTWLAVASLAAILVLAALGIYQWQVNTRSSPPASSQVTRLTFDEGLQTDPTLSPGGTFVAYSSNKGGNFDLYTQPIRGGNPIPITTHQAHDWQPDWSPDDQLVFRSERDGGGLYVVPQTGGHEQRVAKFGQRPKWSPDGKRILFHCQAAGNFVCTVLRDGGVPRDCAACPPSPAFGWLDARHVALLRTEPAPQFRPILTVVDLDTERTEDWTLAPGVLAAFQDLRIGLARVPLAWARDGRSLYFVGSSRDVSAVWRLDFDREARTLSGGPHRMTTMADENSGVATARGSDTVAFAAQRGNPRIWWHPLDGSGRRIVGRPEVLTPAEAIAADPDLSLDARFLVYSLRRPGSSGGTQLMFQTLADKTTRILRVSDTDRGELRYLLRLSPDGQTLAFRYVAPESEGAGRGGGMVGHQSLKLLGVDTGEESNVTRTAPGVVYPGGWSRDGRYLVTGLSQRRLKGDASGMMIALLPIAAAPDAESQAKVVTTSQGSLWQATMSPDGRWLAFLTGRRGVIRVAVVGSKDGQWSHPADESEWRYVDAEIDIERISQDKPRWSADGRLLYFTSPQGGLTNVWAVDFDPTTGTMKPPFRITTFDGPGEHMPDQVWAFEIGVARGGLAIPTLHPTGAIWALHPPR